MKKILGLDLGVASIGWALIREDEDTRSIIGMGCRIVPLSTDDSNEFSAGNAITKNQKRTVRRTQRKGYDRYQLRRFYLREKLNELGMLPGATLYTLTAVELYGLRDKATRERISLEELGRVLFHLNQKRGYKSSRRDHQEDSKETEYVQQVMDRYEQIKKNNQTVGGFLFEQLSSDPHFAVKKKIFPREAYAEEFDTIWNVQQPFYSNILTEENRREIKEEIIFYQRPLKSQKSRVSICEFEGSFVKNKDGKEVFAGPRVAPRSSPLFQVCRIWEMINSISIYNRKGELLKITKEKKQELFDYLDSHEKLTQAELFRILGLGKNEGYYGNKQLQKGLAGNVTKAAILNALSDSPFDEALSRFSLTQEPYDLYDKTTGEVVRRNRVIADFEKEPLYRLWHVIYSIPDESQLRHTLMSKFDLDGDTAARLSSLDFTKAGFGNKSARAIRNILPYLEEGLVYSEACDRAGYNHSDSMTSEDNLKRQLVEKLKLLPKNSLRQPVVEKILNQMINVVNSIIDKYGRPDEIRVELARELKQSKEERNNTFNNYSKRERENKLIVSRLQEYSLRGSRKNIEKWRLYHEVDGKDGKLNAICIYCGKVLPFAESISGRGIEVEHIIPRSRLFDDSFLNKTLAHTACNLEKGNRTAFDFMKSKSEDVFDQYVSRVEQLYKEQKISKAKRDKLLMSSDKIPQDFIQRQLRETQYIARKSRELLLQVCYRVHATSGSVTDYLRHQWGWNDVLANLNMDKYRAQGLTETVVIGDNGSSRQKEVIKGWSKRDDHRHHAIDALVVACTSQSVIQRLNKLNQEIERTAALSQNDVLKQEEGLKSHVQRIRPFTVAELEKAAARIVVSYKTGKKAATFGSRYIRKNGKRIKVQEKIVIPRGALSEESVYGKITRQEYIDARLAPSFTAADRIADKKIRAIVKSRLAAYGNDPSQAFKNLKKNPIWLDDAKTQELVSVKIRKPVEEYVIRYPVQNITVKDIEYVVDRKVADILRERLAKFDNNPKEAFRNIEQEPVWFNKEKNISIKSVRLFTGLNQVAPIRIKDSSGNAVYEKYVKPGNNHHIAVYLNSKGEREEHVVSFWHAVERKKRGLPVVITDPRAVWDQLTLSDKEDNDFLSNLPDDSWSFQTSMQQNELFVFGIDEEQLKALIAKERYEAIAPNIFRVRKLTAGSYWFNQQYETEPKESVIDKKMGRCMQASLNSMKGVKIRISLLGEIIVEA